MANWHEGAATSRPRWAENEFCNFSIISSYRCSAGLFVCYVRPLLRSSILRWWSTNRGNRHEVCFAGTCLGKYTTAAEIGTRRGWRISIRMIFPSGLKENFEELCVKMFLKHVHFFLNPIQNWSHRNFHCYGFCLSLLCFKECNICQNKYYFSTISLLELNYPTSLHFFLQNL